LWLCFVKKVEKEKEKEKGKKESNEEVNICKIDNYINILW